MNRRGFLRTLLIGAGAVAAEQAVEPIRTYFFAPKGGWKGEGLSEWTVDLAAGESWTSPKQEYADFVAELQARAISESAKDLADRIDKDALEFVNREMEEWGAQAWRTPPPYAGNIIAHPMIPTPGRGPLVHANRYDAEFHAQQYAEAGRALDAGSDDERVVKLASDIEIFLGLEGGRRAGKAIRQRVRVEELQAKRLVVTDGD